MTNEGGGQLNGLQIGGSKDRPAIAINLVELSGSTPAAKLTIFPFTSESVSVQGDGLHPTGGLENTPSGTSEKVECVISKSSIETGAMVGSERLQADSHVVTTAISPHLTTFELI